MAANDDNPAAEVAATYWRSAEARDWITFGELLADDVCYEAPQTRERVRGRDAYVRSNREFPGDWHVSVIRLVGSGRHAATWISAEVDGTAEFGLSFLDLDESYRITHITDFWPEPNEPPASRAHLAERY
jgi:hypothetical protein